MNARTPSRPLTEKKPLKQTNIDLIRLTALQIYRIYWMRVCLSKIIYKIYISVSLVSSIPTCHRMAQHSQFTYIYIKLYLHLNALQNNIDIICITVWFWGLLVFIRANTHITNRFDNFWCCVYFYTDASAYHRFELIKNLKETKEMR